MCFMAMGPMIGLMSSAVSAAGAQAQANAQANQAEYNAAVARINRDTARQQGVAQSETIAQRYRRQGGQMTAGYGRAGVVPTSGSAALVLGENERNSWLDQHNAIWNRETEAIGFESGADGLVWKRPVLGGKLHARVSALAAVILEKLEPDAIDREVARLVGDLEHYVQKVHDLVYDSVSLELGGSE